MALHLLQIAKKLAHDAGRLALDYQRRNFKVETKNHPNDLVTEVDMACEDFIIKTIRQHFPDHSILSEESGVLEGSSDYKWIIDPIDGTKNFASGNPLFCVSIAVAHKGVPILGVIEAPALKESFWARLEGGAHLDRRPLVVSQIGDLNKALIGADMSPDHHGERWKKGMELYHALGLAPCRATRQMGSAALALAFVAAGRLDGYFALELHPWDIAAAKVILEEAGGVITNMDDSMLNPKRGMVLASNGLVHQSMLNVVRQVGVDKL